MNVITPPGTLPAGQSARERAQAEQRQASDPAVSAFVGASAGSGKTKLLTDRMLRLMLPSGPDRPGVAPSRIQCLTFTKAAAAEMSLRLQRRLGRWVTLPDAALDHELDELVIPATPASRERARALFAEVLDLPGGHGKVPLESGDVLDMGAGRWRIRDWRGTWHDYRDPEG